MFARTLFFFTSWLRRLLWEEGWQRLLRKKDPTIGKFYQRNGDCNQCGACCKNIYLTFGQQTVATIAELDQLKKRYKAYRTFEPIEENELGVLLRCTQLQEDNTCGIYETRPYFCRKFPNEDVLTRGGKLHADCSYTFEPLKPFDSLLK